MLDVNHDGKVDIQDFLSVFSPLIKGISEDGKVSKVNLIEIAERVALELIENKIKGS